MGCNHRALHVAAYSAARRRGRTNSNFHQTQTNGKTFSFQLKFVESRSILFISVFLPVALVRYCFLLSLHFSIAHVRTFVTSDAKPLKIEETESVCQSGFISRIAKLLRMCYFSPLTLFSPFWGRSLGLSPAINKYNCRFRRTPEQKCDEKKQNSTKSVTMSLCLFRLPLFLLFNLLSSERLDNIFHLQLSEGLRRLQNIHKYSFFPPAYVGV